MHKPPRCRSLDFRKLPAPRISRPAWEDVDDLETLKAKWLEVCREGIDNIQEALNALWIATRHPGEGEDEGIEEPVEEIILEDVSDPNAAGEAEEAPVSEAEEATGEEMEENPPTEPEETAGADEGLLIEGENCFARENSFHNFAAIMREKLDAIVGDHPARLPLFYSFMKDIIAAYRELATLGKVLNPLETPVGENLFPTYLILGTTGEGNDDYRTPFYPSAGNSPEETAAFKKAEFLYRRLEEIIERAGFTELPEDIRITPSGSPQQPLGSRAIPFYYRNDGMRSAWNHELEKSGRTQTIPSYFPAGDEPDSENLRYDIDSWGFFRVEGHLGRSLPEALEHIEKERRRLNIAFDIQCVPLSETAIDINPGECFAELEAAFHQVLNEWLWELDAHQVETSEGVAESLRDYLSTLKDACLHDLNMDRLAALAGPVSGDYDRSRMAFFHRLLEKRAEYKERMLLGAFASAHPGLEHQGGVTPGGTLALVYDGADEAVVAADFNLPYLCRQRQRATPAPEVFMHIPADRVCLSHAPLDLFTYPSGGRVMAAFEGGNLSDAVRINPASGRWQLHLTPELERYIEENREVQLALTFLHSGQMQTAAVKAERLIAHFEVALEPGMRSNTFRISEIAPAGPARYIWTLVYFNEGSFFPLERTEDTNDPFEWIADHGEFIPTYVVIALKAAQGDCTANYEVRIDFPPLDEEESGEENGNDTADGQDNPAGGNENDREEEPEEEEGSANPNSGPTASATGSRAVDIPAPSLDIKKIIAERRQRYLERLNLFGENRALEDLSEFRLVRRFVLLPQKEYALEQNFREAVSKILSAFPEEEIALQAHFMQLLDVLILAFLDYQVFFGKTDFRPEALPLYREMRAADIDLDGVYKRWKPQELNISWARPNS